MVVSIGLLTVLFTNLDPYLLWVYFTEKYFFIKLYYHQEDVRQERALSIILTILLWVYFTEKYFFIKLYYHREGVRQERALSVILIIRK